MENQRPARANPSRGITCYIFCLRWDSIFLWKIPLNDFGHSVRVPFIYKVRSEQLPEVGLEPTWACAHNILSVTCIPFHHSGIIEFLRPRSESNRRIGVLQTPALPLGYAAELYFYTANLQLHFPTSVQIKKCRR